MYFDVQNDWVEGGRTEDGDVIIREVRYLRVTFPDGSRFLNNVVEVNADNEDEAFKAWEVGAHAGDEDYIFHPEDWTEIDPEYGSRAYEKHLALYILSHD